MVRTDAPARGRHVHRGRCRRSGGPSIGPGRARVSGRTSAQPWSHLETCHGALHHLFARPAPPRCDSRCPPAEGTSLTSRPLSSRSLAGVFTDDGTLVNEAIAAAGLGIAIELDNNTRFLQGAQRAEEEARAQSVGLSAAEIGCTVPSLVEALAAQVSALPAEAAPGATSAEIALAATAAAAVLATADGLHDSLAGTSKAVLRASLSAAERTAFATSRALTGSPVDEPAYVRSAAAPGQPPAPTEVAPHHPSAARAVRPAARGSSAPRRGPRGPHPCSSAAQRPP